MTIIIINESLEHVLFIPSPPQKGLLLLVYISYNNTKMFVNTRDVLTPTKLYCKFYNKIIK